MAVRLFWCVERLNAYKYTCARTHSVPMTATATALTEQKQWRSGCVLVAVASVATAAAAVTVSLAAAVAEMPRNAHLCMDYVCINTDGGLRRCEQVEKTIA